MTIIAAIIVIIGLIVFNVRSASPGKDEPEQHEAESARAGDVLEAPQPEEPVKETLERASEDDRYVMDDQTYRKTLQKLHQPKEQHQPEKTQMDDMDYRNALKSMQKRKQD
ncbi:hypothetical protein OZL92_19010 [Bacillus sonorensis]|uniref:Uncharacterized protein n=1 Tax=Bacillus sonorensis L12 TaxID=1274524 RepID=M5P8T9_9BACI|nr:hypothetical protein [Bacillus sonorensis]EME75848.1 hypothetical protein BSONL12_02684 [Bacillus sonorensis L12]MCZ0074311.1 hypothetical protein [Bacillus sonorensis]MCZ0093419.1 hypothetical protein [Bacillus sonorensis]